MLQRLRPNSRKALGVLGPMGHLMRQGHVVGFGTAEGLEERYLYVIAADAGMRGVAAVANICAGGRKECVRMFGALSRTLAEEF